MNLLLKQFLELLFPHDCLRCGAEGGLLCSECMQAVSRAEHPQCFICRAEVPVGNLCHNCAPLHACDQVFVMAPYDQEQVHELIRLYKYEYVQEAGEILADLVRAYLNRTHGLEILGVKSPVVTPVPLSPGRLRQRGYNQSDAFARAVADAGGGIFSPAVIARVKDTEQQATLNRAERAQNMREAFVVTDSAAVLGKDLLIVDDVATTGATLDACALALKDAGARRVMGIVVAHRA